MKTTHWIILGITIGLVALWLYDRKKKAGNNKPTGNLSPAVQAESASAGAQDSYSRTPTN